MEKYNVVIDDEKTKTASTSKTCPDCGRELPGQGPNKNGDVLPPWFCSNCGTKPFEKRPNKEK